MSRTYFSRITRHLTLGVLGTALTLASSPCILAEEEVPVLPPLLEQGGNLSFYDQATMRLHVQERVYRIDPASTHVIIKTPLGIQSDVTGQIQDLATRINRLRGQALSFRARADGTLSLLVLDERHP